MAKYLHPLASAENMKWATRIYLKLMRLAPDLLTFEQPINFKAEGYFAPICLEVLQSAEGCRYVQLHHCWMDSDGEPISDPRIVIVLYPDWEMAEAVMYSDMFSFDEAYPVKDGPVDVKVHRTMNTFLERWLASLLNEERLQRVAA